MKNILQHLFSKKGIIIVICLFCCIMITGFGLLYLRRQKQAALQQEQLALRNQKGLLISFDDYSIESWKDHFDLFDKYGAKVTFFINYTDPTGFCEEAISRGHEIGYHTAGHVNLTEVSKDEFYEQAIAPLEIFTEAGYEITSFAYPYGAYEDWMHAELLKYYDTLRGAYTFQGVYKETLPNSFIDSYPLDNKFFESDEAYQKTVIELLDALSNCNDGTVASVYSHAISDSDWCITPERLEFLLQEAQKRNLAFYTFNEFQ